MVCLRESYISRATASLAGVITVRLPPLRPRARAAARPAWVRSLIRSRSNSARAAKTWKATRSATAANTLDQIRIALRAVTLDESGATIAALRAGLGAFDAGTDLRIPTPGAPLAVGVADTARTAAIASQAGALTIIRLSAAVRRRVLPRETVQATARLAVSPAGRFVAAVRRDNHAAEVIDAASGAVALIPGTNEAVDVAFAGENQLVVFRRDGAILTVDPRRPRAIHRAGDAIGPVRVGVVTDRRNGKATSVATFNDRGNVDVLRLDASSPLWSVPLADGPGSAFPAKFVLGRDLMRICDGRIQLATRSRRAGLEFGIPFSIDENGSTRRVGSFISSLGSVCLPSADAMYLDAVRAPLSVPRRGLSAPTLAAAERGRVSYAIASSANGAWSASAGTDGTLALRRTAVLPRLRMVPRSDAAVGDRDSVVVIGEDGIRIDDGTGTLTWAGRLSGHVARGAYEDPQVGAVIGIGRDVVAVRSRSIRRLVRASSEIASIRPGVPGKSAVLIAADEGVITIVGLGRDDAARTVKLPRRVRAAGFLWDALQAPDRTLTVATADGTVWVLSADGSTVLRRTSTGLAGRVTLAAPAADMLAVGTEDGAVALLHAPDLHRIARRKVLPGAIIDISVDRQRALLLARASDGRVSVLTRGSLDVLAKLGAEPAVNSAVFARGGTQVLRAGEIAFSRGIYQAQVGTWPICTRCRGSLPQLRRAANSLVRRDAAARDVVFRPRPNRQSPG